RLRFEAGAARFTVGGRGGRELAAQAMDLSLLIVSPAGRLALDAAHRTLQSPARLHDRLLPGPVQLPPPGPGHEARPRETPEPRMRLAPVGQCRGPLAQAPEREHAPAAADRRAIEDAGYDR